MKKQISGAVLSCLATTAVAAQTSIESLIPPSRDRIPALQEPTPIRTWPGEQQGRAYLEPSAVVYRSTIVARGAIGLPAGEAPKDRFEQDPPRPWVQITDVLPDTPRISGAPLDDDLAAKAPSQPLMQGFEAVGPNGFTPPDPDLACGYDHVMTVTNDDFAVYDKCGNELFYSDIHTFLGISTLYKLFDPKVVFDPWNDRWVMMWNQRRNSTEESALVFVVSAGGTPIGLGTWWSYTVSAVQGTAGGNAYADDFDLGYGQDFITAGGDMILFSGGYIWGRIWVLDKTQLYSGSALVPRRWSNIKNPDGTNCRSPRAVKMQTTWAEGIHYIDASWINSRAAGGSELTHWKLKDAGGTGYPSAHAVPVDPYALPPDAVQPTGELLDTLDCRLMPAVTTSDTLHSSGPALYTSLTAERSGRCGAMLFRIDPWTNNKKFQSNFGSPGYDYWFASPAADFSGSAFWVFARTADSKGNEPEIRFVDFDQGIFSSSSAQVRDGDGSYHYFSWGEYFGGQLDWGDVDRNGSIPGCPAKVWLYGEYGKDDSWGTYVGATSVFDQGDLGSVTPSETVVVTGPAGGPFSPHFLGYGLPNNGDVGLAYEVSSLPTWLDADPPTGQVYPPGRTVYLEVNDAAETLHPGTYFAFVRFEDSFIGGKYYYRQIKLEVTGSGLPYCFCNSTNPSGNVAPCGNYSNSFPPYGGCEHDDSGWGARLDATGTASVSGSTLVLQGTRGPSSNSTLFFQANNDLDGPPQNYIGDGIQCAGGGLIRLQVRTTSGGAAETTVDIPARSASFGHPISPGETLYYQWWIRDPGGSPCGNESNTSNGMAILWGP